MSEKTPAKEPAAKAAPKKTQAKPEQDPSKGVPGTPYQRDAVKMGNFWVRR